MEDPQDYTDRLRGRWKNLNVTEKAEVGHEATNYAAFVVEEAYQAGKITDEARKSTLLVLGIACAALHEEGGTR